MENMIVPDIVGGIGNQLYFVAQAYIYSKKYNKKLKIKKEAEYLSYGKPRPIYYDSVFSNLDIIELSNTNNFNKVNENELETNKDSNILLTGGYFQKTKYIVPYLSELRELFKPPNNINTTINNIITDNKLNTNNDIVIHIRLADDWTPSEFGNIYTPAEIDRIKNFIKNELTTTSNMIILFSNNIDKAKELLDITDNERIFVSNYKDYEELYLMAQFRRFIASPSTFNIWGIMLSNYDNKEINILWDININDYRIDFYEQYSYLLVKESKYTVVSGYYNVKNKYVNKYNEWFKNTLNIDANYVIFTDTKSYDIIKEYRKLTNTKYVFKNLNDFTLKKENYNDNHIEPTHVPSIELGLIWLNKIEMVKIARDLNYYNSEWFVWMDAGIASLRDKTLNESLKLNINFNILDKTKFYYGSSSNDIITDNWDYIHNIQGGFFIIHQSMINKFYDLFMNYHKKCLDNVNNYICMSDQVILSHIKNDYNDSFIKLCDGYGCITEI